MARMDDDFDYEYTETKKASYKKSRKNPNWVDYSEAEFGLWLGVMVNGKFILLPNGALSLDKRNVPAEGDDAQWKAKTYFVNHLCDIPAVKELQPGEITYIGTTNEVRPGGIALTIAVKRKHPSGNKDAEISFEELEAMFG